MKYVLCLALLAAQASYGQKLKKADKAVVASLQQHIGYLASDQLEGRRTGSAGEHQAALYISEQFAKIGLLAKGDQGDFVQAFEVNDGKGINPATALTINGVTVALQTGYFPLAFSPNASLQASTSVILKESGGPWFTDLKELLEQNAHNPHFDIKAAVIDEAAAIAKKGGTACILYNSGSLNDGLQFEAKDKSNATPIPVIYLTKPTLDQFLKDESALLNIQLKVDIGERKRTGHNVIGYIDNNAPTTVIIGAHYDHLGYGEDHNSLYTGTAPAIHNGADDNASGTAALLELSKQLKNSRLKGNNYVLVAFSGEELGLYGSKFFAEHPSFDFTTANYMINMDMVGRLNDSTHGLNVGGYGTSPVWGQTITSTDPYFTIKLDSAGTGPSDHTSFYRKDLPVLFFFTGVHSDYHKPSDDADKINYTGELQVIKYIYNLIEKVDQKGKLPFTKTREVAMSGKSSFKVSMGIMPDYTYSGNGVRADGISEGKLAQRVGILPGDVLMQLGDYSFSDVQSYMETLAKFKKGDATKVKVKRGDAILTFDIVF